MTLAQEPQTLQILATNAINEWQLAYLRGEVTLLACREGIARILAAQSAPLI
jgi:hypothetical protein